MIINVFQVKLDFKNPAFIFIYKYKYIKRMKNLNIFSLIAEYENAKSGGY